MIGWLTVITGDAGIFAAFPFRASTYLPLALLAVVLTVLLIKGVRLWQEIHEVEEPVTSDDLLATFEQAHADGELDDDEFERVRDQLAGCPGGVQGASTGSRASHDAVERKPTGRSTGDLDEQFPWPPDSDTENGK